MAANHLKTAVNALKKQLNKYVIERDKSTSIEEQAKKNKIFFEAEIQRLQGQIDNLNKSL